MLALSLLLSFVFAVLSSGQGQQQQSCWTTGQQWADAKNVPSPDCPEGACPKSNWFADCAPAYRSGAFWAGHEWCTHKGFCTRDYNDDITACFDNYVDAPTFQACTDQAESDLSDCYTANNDTAQDTLDDLEEALNECACEPCAFTQKNEVRFRYALAQTIKAQRRTLFQGSLCLI